MLIKDFRREIKDWYFKRRPKKAWWSTKSWSIYDIDDVIKNIQDSITDASSTIASSTSFIKSLEDVHVIHGECYVCGQDIDDDLYVRLRDTHSKKVEMHKANLDQAEFSLKKLKKISSKKSWDQI